MPKKKTEEEIIMGEILKLKARLERKNLGHLAVTDLILQPTGAALKCNANEELRMVKQPDGSFKLECRPKLPLPM